MFIDNEDENDQHHGGNNDDDITMRFSERLRNSWN